jgi:hypothetical protein
LANGFFEGRDGHEGGRGEEAGSEISVGFEFFAEAEETLFWADGAGAPFLQKLLAWRCSEMRRVKHTGPPIAPRRIASAPFAAARASSVRGVPWASIEAC